MTTQFEAAEGGARAAGTGHLLVPQPRLPRGATPWAYARSMLPILLPAALTRPADRLRARRLTARLGLASTGWVERTVADLLVTRAEEGTGQAVALKSPRSGRAAAALARECGTLRALAADERLGDWRTLLPSPASVPYAPPPLVAQGWLPGVPASVLVTRDPSNARRIAETALGVIGELHRATGRRAPASLLLGHWVDPALAVLRTEIAWCRSRPGTEGLAAVRRRLMDGLADQELTTGWTHGDFHPGNILLTEDAKAATGVIDWVEADPDGPSGTDACLFVLALRRQLTGLELGACVVEMLRNGALPEDDRTLLLAVGLDLREGEPAGTLLPLLTWLLHVAGNARKSARYGRSRRWVAGNVIPVLTEACRGPT